MPEHKSPRKIRVLSIVRGVRMRWRFRMFLRGLSIVLGAGFLAFLLSAYGLEASRFSPGAVIGPPDRGMGHRGSTHPLLPGSSPLPKDHRRSGCPLPGGAGTVFGGGYSGCGRGREGWVRPKPFGLPGTAGPAGREGRGQGQGRGLWASDRPTGAVPGIWSAGDHLHRRIPVPLLRPSPESDME